MVGPSAIALGEGWLVPSEMTQAEIAQAAGIQVIMDRCPKIEFARLSGELSWSGINTRIITSKVLKAPRA